MSDNAQLPIPKDLLEPFLKQAVSASILQLMGDNGMSFISAAVQHALSDKVDENGKKQSSDYYNKTTYVEYLAKSTIQKIALETVNRMAEEMRPSIEEAVKGNLKKSSSKLAKTLVDGVIGNLGSKWSLNLTVGAKETD